jgi:hypothetical protein
MAFGLRADSRAASWPGRSFQRPLLPRLGGIPYISVSCSHSSLALSRTDENSCRQTPNSYPPIAKALISDPVSALLGVRRLQSRLDVVPTIDSPRPSRQSLSSYDLVQHRLVADASERCPPMLRIRTRLHLRLVDERLQYTSAVWLNEVCDCYDESCVSIDRPVSSHGARRGQGMLEECNVQYLEAVSAWWRGITTR